ncbi:hypothetical protein Tco_0858090 [Tanacetum coccineum]|uniref:Uncharacterized protein n=1 Tax=Tanacetum coccineum TaxID=301880 RepID=A0ABQ5B954_9ASTR
MVEDVENENSNVSNSDEPVLLNTPLSDKVECFDSEDNIDEIDTFLAMEVSSNFEEGYFNSEEDIIFLENLLSDDTTHNLAPEVLRTDDSEDPDTAMKNDEEIVLSLNVADVNSFTFVIWTFLSFFTYPEDSPVILSLRRIESAIGSVNKNKALRLYPNFSEDSRVR